MAPLVLFIFGVCLCIADHPVWGIACFALAIVSLNL
jgi:hypothetical protein